MDIEKYITEFTTEALNQGYSSQNIKKCVEYSKNLNSRNLPIIYNTTHFSLLTGVKKNYIIKASTISKYDDSYYRSFRVQKKNKKHYRTIDEPLPTLKRIQYWILNEILENVEVSPYSKAYKKKSGIKGNTKFHKNKDIVLNIDIIDFFHSIKSNLVYDVFYNLGYSTSLSKMLSKICTLDDSLPQGAPTSPYLSNIILFEFDKTISEYTKSNKINYSRYADDITFSGNFNVDELIKVVENELDKINLSINPEKYMLMRRHQRQIVTGVVVNQKDQLCKNIRKRLRLEFFYISKNGFEKHCENTCVLNTNKYLDKLIGTINYGLYLNSKDASLMDFKNLLLKIKKTI